MENTEKPQNLHVHEMNKLRHATGHSDFETVKKINMAYIDKNDQWDSVLRQSTHSTPEILDWLLENGMKTNNPAYLISYCAEDGKPECLAYLANKGFDLNARQDDGEYPLWRAAMAGRADSIEILLKNGVKPNDQKALLSAIINGHLEATKALVEHGADPTKNNDNALYKAISFGHNEIIDFLIAEHKMPISKETREWLAKENPEHVGVVHIKQILEKRDLFEKLTEKSQRPPQTQQKKQVLKL
jgi:uncharacterized protein